MYLADALQLPIVLSFDLRGVIPRSDLSDVSFLDSAFVAVADLQHLWEGLAAEIPQ